MSELFTAPLRIARDHPALSGHFPGHPVVPGVVLLERVAAALRAWRGAHVIAMPEAKFLAPLLPDESASIELCADGTHVRFAITRDGAAIARGTMECAP